MKAQLITIIKQLDVSFLEKLENQKYQEHDWYARLQIDLKNLLLSNLLSLKKEEVLSFLHSYCPCKRLCFFLLKNLACKSIICLRGAK